MSFSRAPDPTRSPSQLRTLQRPHSSLSTTSTTSNHPSHTTSQASTQRSRSRPASATAATHRVTSQHLSDIPHTQATYYQRHRAPHGTAIWEDPLSHTPRERLQYVIRPDLDEFSASHLSSITSDKLCQQHQHEHELAIQRQLTRLSLQQRKKERIMLEEKTGLRHDKDGIDRPTFIPTLPIQQHTSHHPPWRQHGTVKPDNWHDPQRSAWAIECIDTRIQQDYNAELTKRAHQHHIHHDMIRDTFQQQSARNRQREQMVETMFADRPRTPQKLMLPSTSTTNTSVHDETKSHSHDSSPSISLHPSRPSSSSHQSRPSSSHPSRPSSSRPHSIDHYAFFDDDGYNVHHHRTPSQLEWQATLRNGKHERTSSETSDAEIWIVHGDEDISHDIPTSDTTPSQHSCSSQYCRHTLQQSLAEQAQHHRTSSIRSIRCERLEELATPILKTETPHPQSIRHDHHIYADLVGAGTVLEHRPIRTPSAHRTRQPRSYKDPRPTPRIISKWEADESESCLAALDAFDEKHTIKGRYKPHLTSTVNRLEQFIS